MGQAEAALAAPGPGDGTSQGDHSCSGPGDGTSIGGWSDCKSGTGAIVAEVAPGPGDGTSLSCRLRAQSMGQAEAALAAPGPGDGPRARSGPNEWDEPLRNATPCWPHNLSNGTLPMTQGQLTLTTQSTLASPA